MSSPLIQGKYTVLSLLGKGGMGAVYRVRHEGLHREDALKKLHEQYSEDTNFVDRFMREARAMARLDHPNIIRIYDVFSEGDANYIAMEYFPGESLGKILYIQSKLDQNISIYIVKQLVDALAYAHKQGIVHRDIKPGNILIKPDYTVKIADFGIAALNDEHTLTSTGQMVGSPRYMSPEQARGKGIDQRSDLYSLGMVFYEMVSGHVMYEGDSSVAIIGKLAYSDEELPFEYPDDVSVSVQHIIRKLLQRDVEKRFQSADELAEALNNWENFRPDDSSERKVSEETSDNNQDVTMLHPGRSYSGQSPDSAIRRADTSREMAATLPDVTPPSASLYQNRSNADFGSPATSGEKPAYSPSPNTITVPLTINKKLLATVLATGLFGMVTVAVILIIKTFDNPDIEHEQIASEIGTSPAQQTESSGQLSSIPSEPLNKEERDNSTLDNKSLNVEQSSESEATHAAVDKDQNREIKRSGAAQTQKRKLSESDTSTTDTDSKLIAQINIEFNQLKLGIVNVERAISSADDVAAKKYATTQYNNARRHWNKLNEVRDQAITAQSNDELEVALELVQKAIQLSTLARKAFMGARETAVKSKTIAELKHKQQRLEVLRKTTNTLKATAIQLGAEIVAKAEFQVAKNEESLAEKLSVNMQQALNEENYRSASEAYAKAYNKIQLANRKYEDAIKAAKANPKLPEKEFEILQAILHNFRAACEQKDLAKLKSISNMSDNRLKFVKNIFNRYEQIDVTITDIRLLRNSATATLVIDKLAQKDGGIGMISDKWKTSNLEINKEASGWGKVQW